MIQFWNICNTWRIYFRILW